MEHTFLGTEHRPVPLHLKDLNHIECRSDHDESKAKVNKWYLGNHKRSGNCTMHLKTTYEPKKGATMQMRNYFRNIIICEMQLKVYLAWKLL